MATRGRKRKPTMLHLVNGSPGHRPLPVREVQPGGAPEMPTPLLGRPLELWHRYIATAFWLTSADGPKAWLWCHLQAELEWGYEPITPEYLDSGLPLPVPMSAPRIAQYRAVSAELGMDPSARARLGIKLDDAAAEDDFFGQAG